MSRRKHARTCCLDTLESRLLMSAAAGTTKQLMGFITDYQINNSNLSSDPSQNSLYSETSTPPTDDIDWSDLTQVNYYSVLPNIVNGAADGTVNPATDSGDSYAQQLPQLVSDAHAHNVSVWITVGGGDANAISDMGLLLSSDSGTLSKFASSMASVVSQHGLGGVDLDWEPQWASATQVTNMGTLISDLHGDGLSVSFDTLPNPNDIGTIVNGVDTSTPIFPLDSTALANLSSINLEEYTDGSFTSSSTPENTLGDAGEWASDVGAANISKLQFGLGLYNDGNTSVDANVNYALGNDPNNTYGVFGGVFVWTLGDPSTYPDLTEAANIFASNGVTIATGYPGNTPPPPPPTFATVSGTVTSTSGQGVGGVTVYLDANNDSLLDNGELSTITDSNGNFTFYDDVPAGSSTAYIVRQQMPLPTGDTQVTPAQNYGDHLPTTIVAGTTYSGQDFVDNVPAAVATATVSGTVTNAATGAGIANVTVYLDANNDGMLDNNELSVTTNSSGDYVFNSVPAGSSTAYIVRQELPAGDTQVTPALGYGNHLPVPLVAGDTYSNQNFTDNAPAAAQTATVSGTVTDTSGNGIGGITVFLDANNDGTLDNGELSVTTNSSGYYVFNDVPAGTSTAYIVRQEMPLPSGISQITPSMNYGDHLPVPLVAGDTYANQDFTDFVTSTKPIVPPPLTGTVIGTAGSYENLGNTGSNAFDGNQSTFFDAPVGNGAWVGLDLGSAFTITSIAFAPRVGYEFRMEGGVFQASNDPTFTTGVAELYTIGSTAPVDGLTTVAVNTPGAYRYVRYLSPDGGWGNVAEIQFFGNPAPATAATLLSGAVIGTTGSYENLGNTAANAFDGNLNTFFDAPAPDYQWAGLDLGSAYDLTALAFAPRAGFEYRMVGGIFQASNDPTFTTGVVNLYTVNSAPTAGTLTVVPLNVSGSYRYVRYLAPGGANGNVAEVEFFGTPAASQSAVVAMAVLPFADSSAIGIDELV